VATTLVSWNLKGSGNPDTAAVAAHLRAEGADVVVLQEVQWHQARRIARSLGAIRWHWGFKHWPLRTWPEGMAIIGVTLDGRGATAALSHAWRLWSWRRRILQVARVSPDAPGAFTLVNVHLTPHGQIGLRAIETATVLGIVAERARPVVVAGDLNERPDGAIHRQLADAGLRDAWAVRLPAAQDEAPVAADSDPGRDPAGKAAGRPQRRPDPWPTNWRGWRRGTTEPPTQRLDYVYATDDVRVLDIHTPGISDLARFAGISDHLPVTAVFEVG
jgi:endonuclease/exonuclease/phosphatase family metal-dependent hydrolase